MRAQLGAAAVLVLPANPGRAQENATIGFSLADVVQLALAHNPTIATAREQVRERFGQSESALGAYDLQLRTFVARDREFSPIDQLGSAGAAEFSGTSHLTYGLGVSRRFRSGLVVGNEFGVTRTSLGVTPGLSPNVSTARLTATVPLLRGRGSAGPAATAERSTGHAAAAASLQLRQVAVQTIREVGFRYWRFLATQREVEVYRQAEARARRLTDESRLLVAMDERPASDLTQVRANLAFREAVRIEAEQRLIENRHHLGLVIGLPADEMPGIPTPTDVFPEVSTSELLADSLVAALIDLALASGRTSRRRTGTGWPRRRSFRGP